MIKPYFSDRDLEKLGHLNATGIQPGYQFVGVAQYFDDNDVVDRAVVYVHCIEEVPFSSKVGRW